MQQELFRNWMQIIEKDKEEEEEEEEEEEDDTMISIYQYIPLLNIYR